MTQTKFKYETVTGFFVQDDETDGVSPYNFDPLTRDFGLKKESWAVLQRDLKELQKKAPENVRYKLLFLARHGQGYHNYAVKKYGEEDWDVCTDDHRYCSFTTSVINCEAVAIGVWGLAPRAKQTAEQTNHRTTGP